MGKSLVLTFLEKDIFEKEIISFPLPNSKKLNNDHKYFEKRIVWTLTKWKDTEDLPYSDIEEDRKKGLYYSEIYETLIDEINGFTITEIEEGINLNALFTFKYRPFELDRIILRSDYKYSEIRSIPRPLIRPFHYMSFTYKNEFWEIDKEINKRKVNNYLAGVLKIITN